ncbi:hypothetical protein GCM10007304_32160 [Rhodococcoides trifolii]|uniref:Uncharacterized protein n=1 Tax=Rhodococcoides trifolii TaxID=908250 RepID=A0A917FZP7_9NOCA|nr:hypothetical protein [Rhodococcus trifolii]GGG15623.1 hypothetical protein GCM10007304_32160 [Rhodococcus trifolii]
MSILDVLPSLRAAAPVRFDPELWPPTTECVHGAMRVGGMDLEEVVDTLGVAVLRSGASPAVTVTRVLAVSGSTVLVDGGSGRTPIAAAAVSNRHPVGLTALFDIVSARTPLGATTLPGDIRAGDVLAMVGCGGAAVLGLADVDAGPTREVLLRTA